MRHTTRSISQHDGKDRSTPAQTYLILTEAGPILIMTIHAEAAHPEVRAAMRRRGYSKFIAYPVPADRVHSAYGVPFEVIAANLDETRPVRVLDFDGVRVFHNVPLSQLDSSVHLEA